MFTQVMKMLVWNIGYFVNLYQGKSSLPSLLGNTTASFNQDGEFKSGLLSSSLSGSRVELFVPHFDIGYIRQVMTKTSELVGVGGNLRVYSASISLVKDVQEYDLQGIVASDTNQPWQGKVDNKPIRVSRVYYKSPRVMWRFFGYYGGMNVLRKSFYISECMLMIVHMKLCQIGKTGFRQ